jgi:hypothetical protein
MRLRDDADGLESIPLKLMIVSVVAAMSVVPAANALEMLRDRDFLSRATATLDRLMWTAEILSMNGPGAARTVALDFESEGEVRFSTLTLGDRPDGPNSSAIVLRMTNGLSIIRLAESPHTVIMGRDGSGLEISAEKSMLRMEACLADGVHVIMASAV